MYKNQGYKEYNTLQEKKLCYDVDKREKQKVQNRTITKEPPLTSEHKLNIRIMEHIFLKSGISKILAS